MSIFDHVTVKVANWVEYWWLMFWLSKHEPLLNFDNGRPTILAPISYKFSGSRVDGTCLKYMCREDFPCWIGVGSQTTNRINGLRVRSYNTTKRNAGALEVEASSFTYLDGASL